MAKRLAKMRMSPKGMMKRMAGADTTASGSPDYAKMFLTVMHRMMSSGAKPDTLGGKADYKGIMRGGD